MLLHSLDFDPANPDWSALPARDAVFALFGAEERAEPYLSRTPNLRARLRRLLDAKPAQAKRLQLAGQVRRIEYTLTGSEFESLLCLYEASLAVFGERARKRLHLRPPVFLRYAIENAYPRVYVTSRVTKAAANDLFGPFPSRVAAEKFLDEMLNLFLLRRCHEELAPDPAFAGCIYSEMKKCLAPCYQGCTAERYAEEAAAVRSFLGTRGASRMAQLAKERERASESLDFEKAAEAHARLSRAEAVAASLPDAVRPLAELSGVLVQPGAEPETVALFLLRAGRLAGPALYSVEGIRHPNEQAGSTSLFAHPVMLEAVPLEGAAVVHAASRDELEQRLEAALAPLREKVATTKVSSQELADQLCLFGRWYYRPQAKRIGEVVFAGADGVVPAKAVLRAVSRVYTRAAGATGGAGAQQDAGVARASERDEL